MHDLLPSEMHLWHTLEEAIRSLFDGYGFEDGTDRLFQRMPEVHFRRQEVVHAAY